MWWILWRRDVERGFRSELKKKKQSVQDHDSFPLNQKQIFVLNAYMY